MDIGPQRTRVGLVPYASDVFIQQVFDLTSSTTQQAVLTAVRNLDRPELIPGMWIIFSYDCRKRFWLKKMVANNVTSLMVANYFSAQTV